MSRCPMSTVYVAMHELSARMPVAGRHPREVVPSGRRLTGGASAQSSAGRSVRDVKPTRECHYQRLSLIVRVRADLNKEARSWSQHLALGSSEQFS